jgi:hypothetical protein
VWFNVYAWYFVPCDPWCSDGVAERHFLKCRMAKGKSAWVQLLVAVHERIKVQRDVDDAARYQLETRAGDLEPGKEAKANANTSVQKDGGVRKNGRKGSKGGNKVGGMLRQQVAALVNQKGNSSKSR